MATFKDLNLSKQLQNAVDDMGFETPTPIQVQAFSVIRSGKNVVGIAQTGTGKTLAYMLPILQDLKYFGSSPPTGIGGWLPTRELVLQAVENIESYSKYMSVRVFGVFGGVNIKNPVGAGRFGRRCPGGHAEAIVRFGFERGDPIKSH